MTNLRHNIRALQDDLIAFKDIKKLKLGLKSFKLEPRVPDFDLMPFQRRLYHLAVGANTCCAVACLGTLNVRPYAARTADFLYKSVG
ncbi:hypothetical protein [Cupriavidus sp. a3]|uniref:hypothetical protein n=1 Tax=Cupriavidus sp. a3 TaxID=3242158 RepID=UPI003D9C2EEB